MYLRNSDYNRITTKAKLATICDYLVLYLVPQAMQNHTKFPALLLCKRKKKIKATSPDTQRIEKMAVEKWMVQLFAHTHHEHYKQK